MKKNAVLFLFFLLLPCFLQAADDALRFRVFLTDKGNTTLPGFAQIPVSALSAASMARRQRQGIFLDSTDCPVFENYLKAIREKGYPIVSRSRWMNTVVISANDSSCIDSITTLPFVRSVNLVWVNPAAIKSGSEKLVRTKEKYQTDSSNYYGKAETQIEMLGLGSLHNMGYKGSGMLIAVVDAGFFGVDTMSWFKDLNLVAAKDFIYPPSSIFTGHQHGTSVLSIMAAKKDYSFVGTATDASYCLLRSEDVLSEFPIEEDYWVAAVEFADSIGADIVTSSLGYTTFDSTALSYQKWQLDGKTSFISLAASIAATKGLLVVSSAGNDRAGSWQKISFPADADQVLTVGSVQSNHSISSFSSLGPTADGRIKPDVLALGSGTYIINKDGVLTTGSGTSYATPLIAGMAACLWQALPQLKASELLQCIRESGDLALTPDTVYGYGIPNAQKVWLSLKESLPQVNVPKFYCFPNPAKDKLNIAGFSMSSEFVTVVLYNSIGQKILQKTVSGTYSSIDISFISNSIYMVEFLVAGERKAFQKIVIHK